MVRSLPRAFSFSLAAIRSLVNTSRLQTCPLRRFLCLVLLCRSMKKMTMTNIPRGRRCSKRRCICILSIFSVADFVPHVVVILFFFDDCTIGRFQNRRDIFATTATRRASFFPRPPRPSSRASSRVFQTTKKEKERKTGRLSMSHFCVRHFWMFSFVFVLSFFFLRSFKFPHTAKIELFLSTRGSEPLNIHSFFGGDRPSSFKYDHAFFMRETETEKILTRKKNEKKKRKEDERRSVARSDHDARKSWTEYSSSSPFFSRLNLFLFFVRRRESRLIQTHLVSRARRIFISSSLRAEYQHQHQHHRTHASTRAPFVVGKSFGKSSESRGEVREEQKRKERQPFACSRRRKRRLEETRNRREKSTPERLGRGQRTRRTVAKTHIEQHKHTHAHRHARREREGQTTHREK